MREAAVDREATQDALVLLMVKKVHERWAGHYLGRTAIQKLCYFAKVLGVPFSHSFRIHYYGPYSEELAATLDRLLSEEALVDVSPDRERYSNFKLGPTAEHILTQCESTLGDYERVIGQVAGLGKLDPASLELLSTLHFIAQRVKASGSSASDKSLLVDQFREVKGDKFSRERIEEAYNAMKSAGLLG